MHDFLYELLRGSVPDFIKQAIMLGRDPSFVFGKFKLVYDGFKIAEIDPQVLFDLLCTAIKFRFQSNIGPKHLIDVANTRGEEILSRLDAVLAVNAQQDYRRISFTEYAELRLKVARSIESQNKTLSVETTEGPKKILIKKLVVAARLQEEKTSPSELMPHRDAQRDQSSTLSFINFRRSFFSAVILGDPGGGKTTLTQLLCHDFANQIILENSSPKHKMLDVSDLKIPFRIVLRSYEKSLRNNPATNFLDFICQELRVTFGNDDELCQAFVRKSLEVGQAVLVYDGLDEILDVNTRREIVAKIEQFSNLFPACPSIATSRIVGYTDAPLPYEFKVFTLARFDQTEVEKFSMNFLAAISRKKSALVKELTAKFLKQTEENAADLRSNPLMLGLMLYLFHFRGDVPSNRPEIYNACSMLMFEKWDNDRGINFDFPRDFDLLDLFGHLASRIFGDAEAEEGVDTDWLNREIKDFFQTWYKDQARSVASTRTLVDFITGRAWVMCEVGPNTYKFTHRTFLEYFFARRLEEEAESIRGLVHSKLYDRIVSGEWDVVNHLALQIATFRKGPKAIQAIDALMSRDPVVHIVQPDVNKINYLFFFARTLEYLTIPEQKLLDACGYITDQLLLIEDLRHVDACEVLHVMFRFTKDKSPEVGILVCKKLEEIVVGKEGKKHCIAAYILGNMYSGLRVSRSQVRVNDFELVWETLAEARNKIFNHMREEADHSIDGARLFAYLYRRDMAGLFAKHGLPLAFGKRNYEAPYEVSSLGSTLIFHYLFDCLPMNGRLGGQSLYEDNDLEASAKFVVERVIELALNRTLETVVGEHWEASEEGALAESWMFFFMLHSNPKGLIRKLPVFSDFFLALMLLQVLAHRRGEGSGLRIFSYDHGPRSLVSRHEVEKLSNFFAGHSTDEEKRRLLLETGKEVAEFIGADEYVQADAR
jgi:hypothetical protein